MQVEVKDMTPKEIRLAGLNALTQNLGVVGMIRFLQDTDKGQGDYTKDRHTWLGNPDFNEITGDIEKMRK
jgi:hypothetical protein